MRNLSISRTYENYPGLLHFVLVRRWKRMTGIAPLVGPVIDLHVLTYHLCGDLVYPTFDSG